MSWQYGHPGVCAQNLVELDNEPEAEFVKKMVFQFKTLMDVATETYFK